MKQRSGLLAAVILFQTACASEPPRPNPAFIRFEVGQDAPLTVDTNLIQYAVDTLNRNPGMHALAIGNADATGDAHANHELSLHRARRVRTLILAGGIPGTRLHVAAHGENTPVASNDTEEGRQINRRVQVFFYDPGKGDPQRQYGSALDVYNE